MRAHSCDPPPTADQLPPQFLWTFFLSSALLFFGNSLNKPLWTTKALWALHCICSSHSFHLRPSILSAYHSSLLSLCINPPLPSLCPFTSTPLFPPFTVSLPSKFLLTLLPTCCLLSSLHSWSRSLKQTSRRDVFSAFAVFSVDFHSKQSL